MSVRKVRLPIDHIHQIAARISKMGMERQVWLEKSPLWDQPWANASRTLTFAAFRRLILDALATTREPALGLLVGERLLPNMHGLLGHVAMNSSTIRQAMELVECSIRLHTSLISIRHEMDGSRFRIVFDEPCPLDDIRRPVLEAVVLTVKGMFDYITMGACAIDQIAFALTAPDYTALAEDICKCKVRYGASWTGFAMPAQMVDLPLKMSDPVILREASAIHRRVLEKTDQSKSLAMRVRRIMLEKGHQIPSLTVMARLFHLTPRTLHRRLLEEGASYKTIAEGVRHCLAVEYLKTSSLSIQEIAYLLGYTDLANFRRAFKRWEKIAPSEYRGLAERDPKLYPTSFTYSP